MNLDHCRDNWRSNSTKQKIICTTIRPPTINFEYAFTIAVYAIYFVYRYLRDFGLGGEICDGLKSMDSFGMWWKSN